MSIFCACKKSDMHRYITGFASLGRQVPKTQTVTSSILDSEKGAVLVGL